MDPTVAVDVLAFERVVRPLRRLLARGASDRAAAEPMFAANCGRLAERLRTVPLPAPLDASVDELLAQFDGIDALGEADADGAARAERLDRAWQVLQRVDGILGLPLDDAALWPLPPRRPRFRDRPEPVEAPTPDADPAPDAAPDEAAGAVSPSADDAGRRGRGRGRKGRLRGKRTGDRTPQTVVVKDTPRAEAATPAVRKVLAGARWDTAVADLEVDDDLSEAAGAVGLDTVLDVLSRAPLGHDTWSPIHGAGRSLPAGEVAVGGRVRVRTTLCRPDGTLEPAVLLKGAGPLRVLWHRPFSGTDLERLVVGQKVVVTGVVDPAPEGQDASEPVEASAAVDHGDDDAIDLPDDAIDVLESIDDVDDLDALLEVDGAPPVSADDPTDPVVRRAPVRRLLRDGRLAVGANGQAWRAHYGLGDADADVGELIAWMLPSVDDLEEPLPGRVLTRRSLVRLDQAVSALHPPGDHGAARTRLAFDEALVVELGLSQARFAEAGERGVSHAVPHQHTGELGLRQLADPLDDDQQVAFEAIKRDLRGPAPMSRVLCGPVASTVADVALHALLTVAEGRTQVLVVTSDAPSAQVVHDRFEAVLRTYGVTPLLVAGEPRRADREALRRGEISVVFGPPAVLDQGLEWRRLGLVLAFEQATYGEVALRVRGLRSPRPDLLVVAHTPLPARVLQGAYAGYDLSWVPGHAPVGSGTVWREGQREEAYRALGEAVAAGGQAVIAYPLRRGAADLFTLREVEGLVASLQEQVFAGSRVAIFHGALTSRERLQAWADFAERRAQVLVCTTTVEQMPAFPRPVTGLVEHADRLDPQRLLALRGCVGAAGHLHLVVGNEPDPVGAAFVGALAAGADDVDAIALHAPGFEVAAACGPPVRPAFRWFDEATDLPLLVAARAEAHALLTEDAGLKQGNGPRVARLVQAAWGGLMGEAALPPAFARNAPAGGGGARKKRRRRRRR
ncbi:MAG: hypothetical protein H6733_07985 [Alphaproteobacteria bacterium]|nr:hypothetical protein [Alphaproteobacteria bacterium]